MAAHLQHRHAADRIPAKWLAPLGITTPHCPHTVPTCGCGTTATFRLTGDATLTATAIYDWSTNCAFADYSR
jgi:hypothetical protein